MSKGKQTEQACTQKKEDCFAYQGNGTCKCLRDTDFGGRDCPFYKTEVAPRK